VGEGDDRACVDLRGFDGVHHAFRLVARRRGDLGGQNSAVPERDEVGERTANVDPESGAANLPTFPVSSLLLGDQLSFLGFLLVDVLTEGLLRQEIAEDTKGA
jgi:hypothetical protein